MKIIIANTTETLTIEGYAVSATDSFVDALNTPLGSVVGNPTYGTILSRLKHDVYNNSFLIDVKRCLKDACKFDDRLEFISANVNRRNENTDTVYFDVYFKEFYLKGSFNV